jgi:hypothetical protein
MMRRNPNQKLTTSFSSRVALVHTLPVTVYKPPVRAVHDQAQAADEEDECQICRCAYEVPGRWSCLNRSLQ